MVRRLTNRLADLTSSLRRVSDFVGAVLGLVLTFVVIIALCYAVFFFHDYIQKDSRTAGDRAMADSAAGLRAPPSPKDHRDTPRDGAPPSPSPPRPPERSVVQLVLRQETGFHDRSIDDGPLGRKGAEATFRIINKSNITLVAGRIRFVAQDAAGVQLGKADLDLEGSGQALRPMNPLHCVVPFYDVTSSQIDSVQGRGIELCGASGKKVDSAVSWEPPADP